MIRENKRFLNTFTKVLTQILEKVLNNSII